MPAAPIDPWSAGFMALGSIASAPGPNQTAALTATNVFDNSGFAVNVGGGTARSYNGKSESVLPSGAPAVRQAAQAVTASVGGLLGNPAFMVLVGVALYLYLKHK